jgi:two-component system CheB/CheR fusion protein
MANYKHINNFSELPRTHQKAISLLIKMLEEEFKVNLADYKDSTILRRLYKHMAIHQLLSLEILYEYMKDQPEKRKKLFFDIFIGVTSFFRDNESFAYLKDAISHNLLSFNSSKPYRIWVPGCSTGQEAYSIAIVLHEIIEQLNTPIEFIIFATDINENSIKTAAAGKYDKSKTTGPTPQQCTKYFDYKDGTYKIKSFIREHLIFAKHNLFIDPPFIKTDLISCRNLLIYLKNQSQSLVIKEFKRSLNPGGLLFIGSSESLGTYAADFATIEKTGKLFTLLK